MAGYGEIVSSRCAVHLVWLCEIGRDLAGSSIWSLMSPLTLGLQNVSCLTLDGFWVGLIMAVAMGVPYTHLYYLISFACNELCSKCSHWRRKPIDQPLPAGVGRLPCRCADAGFLILYDERMRHDFDYSRGRPIRNVRRFVQQFQRYARAETTLLSRVPDYFERLAKTDAIAAR